MNYEYIGGGGLKNNAQSRELSLKMRAASANIKNKQMKDNIKVVNEG